MSARSDLDSKRLHRFRDRLRAPDCPSRPIEDRFCKSRSIIGFDEAELNDLLKEADTMGGTDSDKVSEAAEAVAGDSWERLIPELPPGLYVDDIGPPA